MSVLDGVQTIFEGIIGAILIAAFIVSTWPTLNTYFGNATVFLLGGVALFIIGAIPLYYVFNILKKSAKNTMKSDDDDYQQPRFGG